MIIFPFLITLILRTLVIGWNMKALLIKTSTLAQFVEKGYESTSLTDIVKEHFNSYYSELENFVELSLLRAENLRVGVDERTISFLNF
ncbi:hypothetical protein ACQKMI_01590 [Lysinibacillus sp. NPDC097214]|uniref:hypothetical protein n=1 Tax=Lysinibacillus sp. NPDC097214 TaxID=3390584 RepID=UPI003D050AD5